MKQPIAPTLYIHQHGPTAGQPIIFFHGFPGSHRQGAILETWAEKFQLRVLSVDRPGYGHSPPQRDLLSFIQSLDNALNDLSIHKFYLLGVSGGNPAAICAAGHFGDRVVALGSVCGLAPFDLARDSFSILQQRALRIGKWLPRPLLRRLLNRVGRGVDPAERLRRFTKHLPAVDRAALDNEEIRTALIDSMQLAWNQESEGLIFDVKSFANPWPVDFQNVRCPHWIWHGDQDRILSVAMAHSLHRLVPHSKIRIFPGEGHYSLPIQCAEEILKDLTKG